MARFNNFDLEKDPNSLYQVNRKMPITDIAGKRFAMQKDVPFAGTSLPETVPDSSLQIDESPYTTPTTQPIRQGYSHNRQYVDPNQPGPLSALSRIIQWSGNANLNQPGMGRNRNIQPPIVQPTNISGLQRLSMQKDVPEIRTSQPIAMPTPSLQIDISPDKRIPDSSLQMDANQYNKGMNVSPTSVQGIQRVTGGPFGNVPMFTDNPERAVQEYRKIGGGINPLSSAPSAPSAGQSGNFSVEPSTFEADKRELAGYFNRYLNSGDIEGARRTALSQDDYAKLGLLEGQQRQQSSTLLQQQVEADRRKSMGDDIMGRINTVLGAMGKGSRRTQMTLGPIISSLAQLHQQVTQGGQMPGLGGQQSINPLEDYLKQQNAQVGIDTGKANLETARIGAQQQQMGLEQARQMMQLGQAIRDAKTPEERNQLIDEMVARSGKNPAEGRFTVVPQGETQLIPGDIASPVIKQPALVLSNRTGEWINPPGQIANPANSIPPPQAFIDRLRESIGDPTLRNRAIAEFEVRFGKGSANQYIK